MGNSICVPRIGGEPVTNFLRRMFRDKTNNADILVCIALNEELKQKKKEEERKGIWERIKQRMRNGRDDSRSDEELLEAFKPRENEFTQFRRLHENSASRRENIKPDNPYSREDFEKWRRHQESVITSIRATMADRRKGSSLYQTGAICPMSTNTPRHCLFSSEVPTFHYYSRPKIDLNKTKVNRRSVREISGDTPAPWTHRGYGSEPWEEEILDLFTQQNIDRFLNDTEELKPTPDDDFEEWISPDISHDQLFEPPDENQNLSDKKKLQDSYVDEDDLAPLHEAVDQSFQGNQTHYSTMTKDDKTHEPVFVECPEMNYCSLTTSTESCEKRNHDDQIKRSEPEEEECLDVRTKKSFAKKIRALFKSAFNHSEPKNADKLKRGTALEDKVQLNKTLDRRQRTVTPQESRRAEVFFIPFGSPTSNEQDYFDNLKAKFAKRFPNKLKQTTQAVERWQEPVRKAEALFIPMDNGRLEEDPIRKAEPLDSSKQTNYTYTNGKASQNKKYTRRKTKYGTVEHNNELQSDNEMRENRLKQIQTKVDSWKTSKITDKYGMKEFEPAPKAAQYGSVAHNNMIQKDNAMRKKRIEQATTKVDSWKIEEEDNSYLHPNMRTYKPNPKPAKYGSLEHNNKIKQDNMMRKKKLENIHTTLDTWKTKEPDYSYLQPKMKDYELAPKEVKYGSVEHHSQIKKNNALRKMRLDKIHSTLDTWNAPNPGSKYSLKRKDEWEPVLDHKKYGTAAHFHQIKSNNAMRQRRLSNIRSNLDTWNAPNPGSKYSLRRKDEWEPVYDTKKYGSVAHYHQVRGTHAENKYMINSATTKLNTWQPKSKMNLLHASNKKTVETRNRDMRQLQTSVSSGRSKVNTGRCRLSSADHGASSWSRHFTDGSLSGRSTLSEREDYTPECSFMETSRAQPRYYYQ